MSAVLDTIEDVRHMSTLHDAVLVACSFGKDSLATLDLCAKYFKRVEAFCMSFVLGLDVTAKQIQYAKDRWGIEVREVEHWAAIRNKAQGYRCMPQDHDGPLPTMATAFAAIKAEYGISLLATGTRAAESIGRRAALQRGQRGETAGAWPGDWHPLAWWNRADVVGYVKNNNLPCEQLDSDMNGLSNEASSLLRLHDRHPEDFRKWCDTFEFANTVVARRGFYGVGKTYTQGEV